MRLKPLKIAVLATCMAAATPAFARSGGDGSHHHGDGGGSWDVCSSSFAFFFQECNTAPEGDSREPSNVPELNAASATLVGSMAIGLLAVTAERRRRRKEP
ncbi:hypothetical protein [Halioxenophilus sp. WMMB6]|uniref:hypothetical protein n=1 Tax=Halioxenophilus sp. WMMB6 TaxID=3073815 RepID=UPI00295EF559|nr:hypothetical protein [Halioxenophilus sp. WMMB6]